MDPQALFSTGHTGVFPSALNGCAILTKRLSNIELTGKFHPDIFIGKLLNAWNRMLGITAH